MRFMLSCLALSTLAANAEFDQVGLLQINSKIAPLALQDTPDKDAFEEFTKRHGRSYKPGSDEYHRRLELFQLRVAEASEQNLKPDRLWTAAVNHLSDWTEDELRNLRGWRGHATKATGRQAGPSFVQRSSTVLNGNNSHVWNATFVGTAMDQGGCGSCWAVATRSMAEANHHIHMGSHLSMSAQELVDCVPNPQECGGDGGCGGATVELAMYHMMQRGLGTEADEPYDALSDFPCRNPSAAVSLVQNVGKGTNDESLSLTMDELTTPGVIQVALQFAQDSIGLLQWSRLPINEDGPLQDALLQGTVAVSVAGSEWSGYGDGIFDGCSKDAVINHAVVAIGFGKEGEHKYWTLRNSWGPDWGEDGNIRLLRTDTPVCGTDDQPEVGTGCDGGPASVEVCGTCGVLYDSVYAEFR